MKRILLVVDPQMDFINGSLPVPGAEAAMNALAAHVLEHDGLYTTRVVTCDFHPPTHCSFVSNGGQWPGHCTAHSVGAAIWPALLASLHSTRGEVEILCKGPRAETEEYSIFRNPDAKKRLQSIMADAAQIDICGLAGDICVLDTLKDGVKMFGPRKFHVLGHLSPSLDGGASLERYARELEESASGEPKW